MPKLRKMENKLGIMDSGADMAGTWAQDLAELPSAPVAWSSIQSNPAADANMAKELEFAKRGLVSLAERAQQLVEMSLARITDGSRASDIEAAASAVRAASEAVEKLADLAVDSQAALAKASQAQTQILNQGGQVYLTTAELISELESEPVKKLKAKKPKTK